MTKAPNKPATPTTEKTDKPDRGTYVKLDGAIEERLRNHETAMDREAKELATKHPGLTITPTKRADVLKQLIADGLAVNEAKRDEAFAGAKG